ncbi:MAG: hypothetical protein Ct9H90mP9_5770 [Pseudomonadota bacterium]|nr:MAG: hypothetical protein Ct9H90mP9_5770 [Pseudomonadota bacterium]
MIQVIGNEINPATIKSGKNVESSELLQHNPSLSGSRAIGKEGHQKPLVEGGAKVPGSFIKSGCVTRLHCLLPQSDRRTIRTFLVREIGANSSGCNGLEDFVRATPGSGFSSDC